VRRERACRGRRLDRGRGGCGGRVAGADARFFGVSAVRVLRDGSVAVVEGSVDRVTLRTITPAR
jgi:hypothetical protein